jgi:hypothetical protein
MIHHLSIPARDPRLVADVLAELLEGRVYDFPAVSGAYMAVSGDALGTMIEVYPESIVLVPGERDDAVGFIDARKTGVAPPLFVPFHALVSVPREREEIERIGARVGWRTKFLGRGAPGRPPVFHVIEFWIEDKLMLELATPSMIAAYENTIKFEILDRVLSSEETGIPDARFQRA